MFTKARKPNGTLPQFAGSLDGLKLEALALVCLSDELRPEAGTVLEALAAQGIAFKVISGDNPETVRATVSHLKLPLARDPNRGTVQRKDECRAACARVGRA